MALNRELEPEEEAIAPAQPMTSSEAELGLAIGIIVLGMSMMLMVGMFHFIIGLSAILNDEFYTVRSGYDFEIDATTWGWIHVIGGLIMMIAGTFLVTGAAWARLTTLGVVILSVLWSFYSIPYYPIWSLVIIAIDLALLWALVAHGRELSQ